MTTPNIDTKALLSACATLERLHGKLPMLHHGDMAAMREPLRALLNAAPALLDLADRAQEQAKEIEELRGDSEKWRTAARVLCGAHVGLPQSACPVCERDALKAEVEELRAFKATWGSVNSEMHAEIAGLAKHRDEALMRLDESEFNRKASEREVERLQARNAQANESIRLNVLAQSEQSKEIERLREALTPSGETKAAYSHEFAIRRTWTDENGADCASTTYVPWTTIKDIMAAISKRAALRGEESPRE